MKLLLLVLGLLTLHSTAFSADIICDRSVAQSRIGVDAEPRELVFVQAAEPGGSGYIWTSSEGLEFERKIGEKIGSSNIVTFTIDSAKQRGNSKSYTFKFARPWEPKSKPKSKCVVVVRKKNL